MAQFNSVRLSQNRRRRTGTGSLQQMLLATTVEAQVHPAVTLAGNSIIGMNACFSLNYYAKKKNVFSADSEQNACVDGTAADGRYR